MIVKVIVIARNGRGRCEVRVGDRLTIRPDGKLDKTRRLRKSFGCAVEPLAAGEERKIGVFLNDFCGLTDS